MGDAVSTAGTVGCEGAPKERSSHSKETIKDHFEFNQDDEVQVNDIDAPSASCTRSPKPAQTNPDQAIELFGVIRHAERADQTGETWNGGLWHESPDFSMHPNDPPLSDAGCQQAVAMADTIKYSLKSMQTGVQMIVTSPYMRCVQTACTLARRLEGPVRLMIDFGLAEMFGPEIFGDIPPSNTVRKMDELLAYAKKFGVEVIKTPVGIWPTWPETLSICRKRYMERLLVYLMRGERTRRNFLLVSHADCVGSALALMPSQGGRIVEHVGSGGMFLSSRNRHSLKVGLSSTLPTTHPDVGLLDDKALSKAQMDLDKTDKVPSKLDNPPSEVAAKLIATPWSVDTWNVVFGDCWCDGKASAVKNAMNALRVHGAGKKRAMSQNAVEALLGVLPSERSCGADSPTSNGKVPEPPGRAAKAAVEAVLGASSFTRGFSGNSQRSEKPPRRLSWKLTRQSSGASSFGRGLSCSSQSSDMSYETHLFGYSLSRSCSPQGDDDEAALMSPLMSPGSSAGVQTPGLSAGRRLSTITESFNASERSLTGSPDVGSDSPKAPPKLNMGLSNIMRRRRDSS